MDKSHRIRQCLQQLAQLIFRHAPTNGTHATAIPTLSFMHATELTEPLESVYKPSICVVAQGAKTATLADKTYIYNPSAYLVTSVELPIIGEIIDASPEVPYLSLKLSFEADIILDIVKEMNAPVPSLSLESSQAITVNRTSPELLDAIIRLLSLLDHPGDISVLAPLFIREILYRVLQSEQGAAIQQFANVGSYAYNIAKAIQLINRKYDRPLAIDQLASSVNMSTSAFHKHFKRVTTMSPLQYQKTVRLQEARRLMLTETLQAADAAFRVGYESPSQFSREYARKYGRPPKLDIKELRGSLK